jgi:crotonobetainyl-CoA:carnitine CoA-transferase CaiB-like acyl-CoA transferase
VYPAEGEDTWVAVAVFDDDQWQRLVDVLGRPDWAIAPEFADLQGRSSRQDELDARLSQWTMLRPAHETMHLLQHAGVPAGAVQNSRDLAESDPQIADRGTFFELDHPVIGVAKFEGTPIRFTSTVQQNWRSAPLLGEDNDYVFGDILGLGHEEIADLTAEGVI